MGHQYGTIPSSDADRDRDRDRDRDEAELLPASSLSSSS
jgi:hypothetical protein